MTIENTNESLNAGNENQQTNLPSGQPIKTSGDDSDNKDGDRNPSYESFQKVLAEKKAAQAKAKAAEEIIAKYNEDKKIKEEESLKQKQDYQKLAELKEQEAKELKGRLASIEDEKTEARKLSSFLDSVQGDIDNKYWSLIDTDKILINPDTNEIDKLSVDRLVQDFQGKYPETIGGRNITATIPANAPSNEQGLTYEAWLKLPPKEMAKRMQEIIKRE